MSPERWDRVSQIFSAALEKEPHLRATYLQEECGPDLALRAEVESLLDESAQANSFLERPVANLLSNPPRQPAPVPSQIGRYHVVGTLGRGGMGTVYSAWDPVIGRLVAIKVINVTSRDSLEWEQYRKRFHREAQIAGRLQHSSIVMLFDVGQEQDRPYLVMEFVPGKSLAALLKDNQPLSVPHILPLLWDLAIALDYAHSCDVVHRDIKPGNILLHDNGTVKITDFGIAKFMSADSRTTAGLFVGTLGYVAPEIGRAASINGRVDQFSLAVLTYRLLTGHMPHEARTVAAFSDYLNGVQPEGPSKLNPAVPPEADGVVLQALSKNPAARFPSCVSFVIALRTALKR